MKKSRKATIVEHIHYNAEGKPINVEVHGYPIFDSAGQLRYMIEYSVDVTERKKLEAEREALQQRLIQELSTPIIPVMKGVIVLPLVGSVDAIRASGLMRAMMAGIREHRAKIVILDITGVSIVDTGVAGHFDKTIQAARLKGAETILTGIVK